MLTDNSGEPLVPTARISMTTVDPQLIDAGDCDGVGFHLNNQTGIVSIVGNGRNTVIEVKGEAALQFEFVASKGCERTKPEYVPIGITFEEEPPSSGNLADPLGLVAFPDRLIKSVNGTTTVLVVTDKHPVSKEEVCFKFALVIQKAGAKKPIIIDPKIRNVPM